MSIRSTLLTLALAAAPAAAVELIELKNGKVIPVEGAFRKGDRIHARLAMPRDQYAATTFPISQIVPEFAFYIWARGIAEGDLDGQRDLAEWARRNGLFRQARKVYEAVAEGDPATREALPELGRTLHEEEATWLFERAEKLFQEDEVRDARVVVGRLLAGFQDTGEAGRAGELAKMIEERDKFLSEERLRKEQERRTQRQRNEARTKAARIGQGDAYAGSADMRYVGEARWRLRWAVCLYEGAASRLAEALPFVEDEGLRKEIEAYLQDADARMKSAYLRLADLRYLCGDFGAALDAVHRVLDLDPANAMAAELRNRILDGPGPMHIRRDGGFLTYRRRLSPEWWEGGFGVWGLAR